MLDEIEKKHVEKGIKKLKDSPASVIGLLGLTSIVGISAYHYRKKPADMKTSMYM
jgi:hypothetical protein